VLPAQPKRVQKSTEPTPFPPLAPRIRRSVPRAASPSEPMAAGGESQKLLLSLIRDFASEKSHGGKKPSSSSPSTHSRIYPPSKPRKALGF
jgi:hypothetical protein